MTDARTLADPALVELEAQPTAAVRLRQPMAGLDLGSAFDRLMPLVAAEIEANGGAVGGPPFGRYHQFGPDIVDVEIGFPTSAPPELLPLASRKPGEVGTSELPGGPIARAVHLGPYDGLSASYDALHDWIHAQPGFDDGAGPWESYVDDPGSATDPAGLRTELFWPLVRG
jgi:effector-binding domain-containing protein